MWTIQHKGVSRFVTEHDKAKCLFISKSKTADGMAGIASAVLELEVEGRDSEQMASSDTLKTSAVAVFILNSNEHSTLLPGLGF